MFCTIVVLQLLYSNLSLSTLLSFNCYIPISFCSVHSNRYYSILMYRWLSLSHSTHTTPSSIRRRNRLSTNSTTSSPPQVPPPHSIRPPPHTLTRTRALSPSRANLLVGSDGSLSPSRAKSLVGREGSLSPSRANSLVGREGSLSPSRANSLVGREGSLSPLRANSLVGTCSLSYKIRHIYSSRFELLFTPPPPSR